MQNFPHIFAFKFAFIFSKTLQILLFIYLLITPLFIRKTAYELVASGFTYFYNDI